MTIKEVCKKYSLTQDTLRFYEKAGMIPPVHRTEGGIRDYTEEDLRWVELAKCMRSAGLPVEAMAEYVRLCLIGDETIPERLALLKDQMAVLLEEKEKIEATISRLEYKISRYDEAVKTGRLVWDN